MELRRYGSLTHSLRLYKFYQLIKLLESVSPAIYIGLLERTELIPPLDLLYGRFLTLPSLTSLVIICVPRRRTHV